jgi:hypothetical protein
LIGTSIAQFLISQSERTTNNNIEGIMIKAQRCRALRNINAHQGLVKARTTGTIEFETNNLGRRLIKVQWDNSIQMYVFPDEIELTDTIEIDRHAA